MGKMVCDATRLKAWLPLWRSGREELLEEFLANGFEAKIVAVKAGILDRQFLGRKLDRSLIEELSNLGIDPCGEYGEYHTVVTSGPLFRKPLQLIPRDPVLLSGYWFLDFELGE